MSMRAGLDMFDEFTTRHLSSTDFLGLPQVPLDAASAEPFLGGLAQRGYLLVGIATDVAEHGTHCSGSGEGLHRH